MSSLLFLGFMRRVDHKMYLPSYVASIARNVRANMISKPQVFCISPGKKKSKVDAYKREKGGRLTRINILLGACGAN